MVESGGHNQRASGSYIGPAVHMPAEVGFQSKSECEKSAYKHYRKDQGLRAPHIQELTDLAHLVKTAGYGVFPHM